MKKISRSFLATCLRSSIAHKGVKFSEAASEFGISPSYLSQLLSGEKSLRQVDEEVLRKMAHVMDISPVECFAMAGKLKMKDFEPSDEIHSKILQHAIETVSTSKFAIQSGVDIDEIQLLSDQMKVLLINVYQQAVGEIIVGKSLKEFIWYVPKNYFP